MLLFFVIIHISFTRKRRRQNDLTNEHLIMAYRKQNRTLPSAQGTDVYNIYGGADNRPMGSQSPTMNHRNTHAHQDSLPRSLENAQYQNSLPRSAHNELSLPRSNASHYQNSLARSQQGKAQRSLPRSQQPATRGQQNSLEMTDGSSGMYQNSAPRVGGLPGGMPAAESIYANTNGASSPVISPRDSRYSNGDSALQLTRV